VTAWYAATPLITLRDALNKHWPHRDHGSDGFIGDERHAAIKSDHNPDPHSTPPGCVRGGDFDADGINAGWVAEHLRQLGAAGDTRLAHGGYVIFDRKITAPDFSYWMPYEGPGKDPHTGHLHVSTARGADRDNRGWPFLEVDQAAASSPAPDHPGRAPKHDATGHGAAFRAELGDQGPAVERLQSELNDFAPGYSDLAEDGIYGPATAAVVAEFAHREAHDPATPPPHADLDDLEDADGRNVGPRIAASFVRDGLRL
jgi:hypothetical protein